MLDRVGVMGAPGLVMGPCIVEIDRIVIREVQYQLEVNWCRNEEIIVKGNFGWAWPMWEGCPRVGIVEINRIVIREVQYQFEVNRCRNEEIIVKGNFGWACPMWAERPRINRIVIRKVQYQFEVNRCRNEEIIAGRPRIGNRAMHKVRYQFEDNRCRNEEVIFQGSIAYNVGGDSGQDGQTDRQTDGGDNHNIPTLFKKRGDNK
ncbi:hypothetical protein DPMN_133996 [Dreissena polymorpha]|uniref:Uncharacterized protein n=1 Tax=Dreissena polymorpha TaxID=45954 RepID=A0A9D4FUR6_DREPO|nr:hypothetical protein DPMN_133996 [Dreissena polymorpha]